MGDREKKEILCVFGKVSDLQVQVFKEMAMWETILHTEVIKTVKYVVSV